MIGMVIVNYNDYKNTIKFIESILSYKIIEHIVIVDNCSTDNSVKEIEKICNNKIKLIKNISNKGYGSGINLGSKYLIEHYDVKYIIVSNTDIIINCEEDLKTLLSFMRNNIAIIGPTILENGDINRGWKVPSVFVDCLLNLPIIHRKIRKKLLFYKNDAYNSDKTVVEAVSGCFFIINAKAFVDVDFFDENIFLYYEENVIASKLKAKNYQNLIINNVKVIHNHSVTIDKSFNRIKKFKVLKKSQRYFHKTYSKASIIGLLFLFITYKFMLLLLYISCFFHKLKHR